jgi:hypothetical protein
MTSWIPISEPPTTLSVRYWAPPMTIPGYAPVSGWVSYGYSAHWQPLPEPPV